MKTNLIRSFSVMLLLYGVSGALIAGENGGDTIIEKQPLKKRSGNLNNEAPEQYQYLLGGDDDKFLRDIIRIIEPAKAPSANKNPIAESNKDESLSSALSPVTAVRTKKNQVKVGMYGGFIVYNTYNKPEQEHIVDSVLAVGGVAKNIRITSESGKNTQFGLLAGYRFNNQWAIEVNLNPKEEVTSQISATIDNESIKGTASQTYQGLDVFGRMDWHVQTPAYKINTFGKLGISVKAGEFRFSFSDRSFIESSNTINMAFGVGAEASIAPSWSMLLGFDYFPSMGNETVGKLSMGKMYLGLVNIF